jgi:hypothetical protein
VKVYYAHQHPPREEDPKPGIFLAGPSPRDEHELNWRPYAVDILKKAKWKGDVYVPIPEDGKWERNYEAQIDWELRYLHIADAVLFWVPRDLEHLPGFTTNIEFGMFLKSRKIVLGHPEGAPKTRYLDYVARLHKVEIYETLEGTVAAAMRIAKGEEA